MTFPTIEQRAARPYLGISGRITDGVPAFVDKAFPELFRWLGEHGVEPAGPPFIRLRELDTSGEPVEIDVGAPVDGTLEGDERVRADSLPAGRYLTFMHVGPYRSEAVPDLAVSRERLVRWAAKEGIVHSPWWVERYLIGPMEEPDFTRWETEFAFLVLDE